MCLSIASLRASDTGISSARATALSAAAISLESRTVETTTSLMPSASIDGPSEFHQPSEDHGGPRREDERADLMQETGSREVTHGSLDSVGLVEHIRSEDHLTRQLVERQNLGVDEQDFLQNCRLVAIVLVGGGRGALIMSATRLVVHGSSPSCAMPPAVRAARGRFV